MFSMMIFRSSSCSVSRLAQIDFEGTHFSLMGCGATTQRGIPAPLEPTDGVKNVASIGQENHRIAGKSKVGIK